ncbi:MAG: uroporphyrinogen decarboxylase [Thermodesulfobacteriota bacterium]
MINNFNGLKVTSFESRRSSEMEKLISYHGGIPRVAPSMKELPIESINISDFVKDLSNNDIDVIVLFTGVGTRMLSGHIEQNYNLEKYVDALKTTKIIARGPKPVAALKEISLKPDLTIPEPNTWRDILTTIDEKLDINNKTVYVQEYGVTNKKFLNGLEERGANVKTITIYKWGLPEDLTPLNAAIKSISDGVEDLVIFTSSQQIVNLFSVASKQGLNDDLYDAFSKTLVGSIGPTTTETLENYNITADYEPDSPKMGNFVKEIARVSNKLLLKKRTALNLGIKTVNWKRTDMSWGENAGLKNGKVSRDSVFLRACNLEESDYTPIWIMRQAGRFLREYRDIRSKVTFLDLCKTPDLSAEVTLMAVERLNVDAAIIFSDILLILQSLGLDLEYSKNDGPRINKVLRSSAAVDSLVEFNPESLGFVYEAIKLSRRALNPEKALIGFAGAPFTVASYAIEGGGSRNYTQTKTLMFRDPGLWNSLMIKLTNATAEYLNKQINAGADAVQLFDSWVGCLSPNDYRDFVLPHMKKLVSLINKGTPVILFGTDTSSLLEDISDTGCGVIGIDWRIEIEEAWKKVGFDKAIQGNLDPLVLMSTQSYVKNEAKRIIDEVSVRPGHIFNLGHGVLPNTPVDNVLSLVDTVHEYSYKMNKS